MSDLPKSPQPPRPSFDDVSTARRRNLAAVRSQDTTPELIVRRLLHALGYRYQLQRRDLPGRPDIVFPGRKTVIDVRGCFWHRHSDPSCRNAVLPRTRADWWAAKLARNVERDSANVAALEAAGWSVVIVWECEVRGDLPCIDGDAVTRGARRPGQATFVKYRQITQLSAYATQMRTWPAFEATEGIEDHLIRYLPRDGRIFEAMPEGAQYPAAREIAVQLFGRRAANEGLRPRMKAWKALYKEMVPPYRTDTFPNRWWKLIRAEPSRTLMAHLGKDCYSHIHYDGTQRRTISIREAARLQSFPDGFKFAGTMNPSFRQIGNAVPPIMAWEIAKVIRSALQTAVVKLAANLSTTD